MLKTNGDFTTKHLNTFENQLSFVLVTSELPLTITPDFINLSEIKNIFSGYLNFYGKK